LVLASYLGAVSHLFLHQLEFVRLHVLDAQLLYFGSWARYWQRGDLHHGTLGGHVCDDECCRMDR